MRKVEIGDCTLYNGDAFEVLPMLGDESIDAVISDPPFGITACEWDKVPPLPLMWEILDAKTKPTANFVMFAAGGFTIDLVNSNRKWFRYDVIWAKNNRVGFMNANLMPMRAHESILVFGRPGFQKSAVYNPVKLPGGRPTIRRGRIREGTVYPTQNEGYTTVGDGTRHPCSVLAFSHDRQNNQKGLNWHPTSKPITLMAYLAHTYSNPGDVILDPFMGSGTTAIACDKLHRRFIGIEKSEKFFDVACRRLIQEREKWARNRRLNGRS